MNIASFLIPRSMVTYLYDDFSIRQALEKMTYHGQAEVPVITRENVYVGTLKEGDLLVYLTNYMKDSEKNKKSVDFRDLETVSLREILSREKDPTVSINTSYAELVSRTMDRSFIPVTDDRNSFIGIVTRMSVMRQLVTDMKQIQYEELFEEQLETNDMTVI